jgi:hypothetical protein
MITCAVDDLGAKLSLGTTNSVSELSGSSKASKSRVVHLAWQMEQWR